MIYFITGFMGVGKTTIGRELALELDAHFIDLDEAIENRVQKSVSQIFSDHGEIAFRDLEEWELNHQIKNAKSTTVISLGGGTIAHRLNHMVMLRNGLVIYLKKEWEEIEEGLKTLENRPLLKELDTTQLKKLFNERRPFYELAQVETLVKTGFDTKKLVFSLKLLTNR